MHLVLVLDVFLLNAFQDWSIFKCKHYYYLDGLQSVERPIILISMSVEKNDVSCNKMTILEIKSSEFNVTGSLFWCCYFSSKYYQ